MRQEIVQETMKAAPPVAVTGWAWLHGLTISDVVGYATIFYIALQAGYLVWKWLKEIKRSRK